MEKNGSYINAYIDESGTNELDSSKTNVSNLFVCAAVVADDKNILELENGLTKISEDLCSKAPIKSSRIGSNHKKRLEYLDRIKDLPFGYFALVINKDRIYKDSGLKHKRSFYKYINRMLYQYLINSGKYVKIFADQLGGQDFMNSFTGYLDKKFDGMLFPTLSYEHSFVKEQYVPGVQLSDLIAGTLTYCLDEEKKDGDYSAKFREILRPKEIDIICWPEVIVSLDSNLQQVKDNNSILKITCLNRAKNFIEQNNDSESEDLRMQASTLSRLLFARKFEDKNRQAIYSDELIEKLQKEGFRISSKKTFSANVIGKIREAGVVIAGTADGYRLAITIEDIQDYLKHDKNIIEPMLSRLLEARKSVKLDTANSLDILNVPEYKCLNKIADAFRDYELECGVIKENGKES